MSDDRDDTKVVRLRQVHSIPGEPNAAIIDMLEGMLANAKAGLITGCAVALIHSDESTGSAFETGGNWAKMVGCCHYLTHRVIQSGEGF